MYGLMWKRVLCDITNLQNDSNTNNLFNDYEQWLEDALYIVQKQKDKNNNRWAKSVKSSLKGVRKMVTDIKAYKNRNTNPRTWKDHNQHTMFLE